MAHAEGLILRVLVAGAIALRRRVGNVDVAAAWRRISGAASWCRFAVAAVDAAGGQSFAVYGLFEYARNLL